MGLDITNPKTDGATRVTVTFWTEAPYSKAERARSLEDFAQFIKESDEDMIDEIRFEDKKEIIKANRKAIVDALNDAQTEVSLRFGEAHDDLVYVCGSDDNE
jgi:hypothetical protein